MFNLSNTIYVNQIKFIVSFILVDNVIQNLMRKFLKIWLRELTFAFYTAAGINNKPQMYSPFKTFKNNLVQILTLLKIT